MPRTYTLKMIDDRLAILQERGMIATVSPAATEAEKRELLARRSEDECQDYVDAWEIRTGRPWTEMTKDEAKELARRRPDVLRNPAVLSKLLGD